MALILNAIQHKKLIFDSISFNKGNYLFLYIFMAIFSCDHTYVKLYDIS